MFHYLDNPNIPKTTNSIESFFGHLKGNIAVQQRLIQRTLQKLHQVVFVFQKQ